MKEDTSKAIPTEIMDYYFGEVQGSYQEFCIFGSCLSTIEATNIIELPQNKIALDKWTQKNSIAIIPVYDTESCHWTVFIMEKKTMKVVFWNPQGEM